MNAGDTRHTKRKQDDNVAERSSLIKKDKVVPSILKNVSQPRRPRIGNNFQALILPVPAQSTPKTQPRSEPAADHRRPSSATTTEDSTATKANN
jgi:hypothetical protein